MIRYLVVTKPYKAPYRPVKLYSFPKLAHDLARDLRMTGAKAHVRVVILNTEG